eukprot:g15385.t1
MERTSSSAALATMTDRQRRHHSRSAAKAPPMMTMPISRAPPISSVLQKQEPPANSLHPRKRPPERQAGGPAGEQQAVSGSSKQSEAIARNARTLAISVVPQKRKARRREQGKAKTSTASRYRHALECVNAEPTNVLPGSIVPPYVKIPGRVQFSGTGARYFNLRTKKHFWRLQDPNVLPEVWWWWLSAVSRIKRRRNELKPVPSFLLPDVINHRMRRDEHEARKRVPQAAPPPPTSGLGEAVREMAAVWRASASPDCPRIFFRKTFGALWERAWIDAACSVSRHRWDHVRMHFSRGLPPRTLVVPASCTTHAHTPADAVIPWQLVLRYPQLVAAQPRFWRKYRSIATGAAGTEGGQLWSGLDRPSLWGPVLPWRFRHDVDWLWEHANDRFRVYQRKGRRKILRFKTGRDLFWQRRERLERRRAEATRLSGNNSCSGTPPQESSAQSESALLSPAELRRLAREIARKREAQPALQSYVHVRDPDNPNAFAANPVWNYVSEAEKQETRRVRASYGRGAAAPSEVHAAVGEIRPDGPGKFALKLY